MNAADSSAVSGVIGPVLHHLFPGLSPDIEKFLIGLAIAALMQLIGKLAPAGSAVSNVWTRWRGILNPILATLLGVAGSGSWIVGLLAAGAHRVTTKAKDTVTGDVVVKDQAVATAKATLRAGAAALILGLGLMFAQPARAASKLVIPTLAMGGGWSVDARQLDDSRGFWNVKATWQPRRHLFVGPRYVHHAGQAGRIETEASFVF